MFTDTEREQFRSFVASNEESIQAYEDLFTDEDRAAFRNHVMTSEVVESTLSANMEVPPSTERTVSIRDKQTKKPSDVDEIDVDPLESTEDRKAADLDVKLGDSIPKK